YGSGTSLGDIACFAGCSEGVVELYTKQCFHAIDAMGCPIYCNTMHDAFVCLRTATKKEQEKCWVDGHLGFKGTWWQGWVMYDGTIVPLYAKLAVTGEAYFT
ncbi:hypothetical protein PAXRUDRAFT_166811, partial [Paxillus rubicundulus Ve08.2h10]